MFLIYGLRTTGQPGAMTPARCPRCQHQPTSRSRGRRWPTRIFVPIVPFKSFHRLEGLPCGDCRKINEDATDQLLAGTWRPMAGGRILIACGLVAAALLLAAVAIDAIPGAPLARGLASLVALVAVSVADCPRRRTRRPAASSRRLDRNQR